MGGWEEIQHTADLALRVWGESLADLFICAAHGMFSLVAEAGSDVRSQATISLTAPDAETLLVDWLGELLYLHDRHGAAYTEVAFAKLTRTSLNAEVTGYAIAQPRAHIKAVTYHMLSIVAQQDGYETEIVFDV